MARRPAFPSFFRSHVYIHHETRNKYDSVKPNLNPVAVQHQSPESSSSPSSSSSSPRSCAVPWVTTGSVSSSISFCAPSLPPLLYNKRMVPNRRDIISVKQFDVLPAGIKRFLSCSRNSKPEKGKRKEKKKPQNKNDYPQI